MFSVSWYSNLYGYDLDIFYFMTQYTDMYVLNMYIKLLKVMVFSILI